MEQHPESKSNKKLFIILAIVAFLGVSAVACCGVAGWFGFTKVQDMDKTYYTECEDLNDSDECNTCCRDRGHSGHVHGEMINEEGKTCGCI